MPVLTDNAAAGNTVAVFYNTRNITRVYHGAHLIWPNSPNQAAGTGTVTGVGGAGRTVSI